MLGVPAAAQPLGTVEQELAKVRNAGQELYTRDSTVFGKLPGPEDLAAQQMRCRPLPRPDAKARHEMDFDEAVTKRAAALDPAELRKLPGRLQMTVLPVGITGAYVVEAMGRDELLVVHVLPDSPATGALKLDDIIIGANGRLFADDEDPRPELGNALCESQSPALGGILTLQVVRDRKPLNVKMDLGSTLDFSDTWPYNCEKTRLVRSAALKYVMDSHPWHRYDFWTPAFLMASGDDAALELARRELCSGLKSSYEENTGGSAWSDGYRLTNLCEYYLLTGDSYVLPAILSEAQAVSWAQYRSGSWSHGAGKGPNVTAPGMASGGYGEVNNAGLGALIGLCLARQCGVVPYKHTIPRSIRFFGPFCGENLGYGLGTPSDSRTGRMDNGMNGMSAMVFHLLGEDEMAQRWARSVCYMWMGRERGHAEAIFSAAWGPVCAALAPRAEFGAFMNHMKWAYEMGRTRDGGLSFMRGSRWSYPNMTAAVGLFLYLPEKRLQILGGDSVFARKPPAGLEEAARLYREKRWPEVQKFLKDYLAGAPASDEHRWYATKLLEAQDRVERHAAATLKIIGQTIESGDAKTAELQLDLLAKFIGQERPESAAMRKKLAAGGKAGPAPKRGGAETLVDARKLMKDLGLKEGGIRDGWAHSSEYITRTNQQGFAGMTPEQIAPFLGHFSGGVEDGAALAMARYGQQAVGLLKNMLTDKHPGLRAGALDALSLIYASKTEEPRTEIPRELADIIKLVRPMLNDQSNLVRNAVSRFVLDLNVVNEDVYDMVHSLAVQGAAVDNFVRYSVKDPQVRVRLCMAIIDGDNKRVSAEPGRYIPMVIATSAHLDLCEPYVQTAVDTLNNPEAQIMYGFFSNHPEAGALQICERYCRDPLVMKNLPRMIRCSMLRGVCNSYWDVHKEYPHRIAVRIGPEALPVIEKFWREERKLFDRIQAGSEPKPQWWKPELPNGFEENSQQWQDTAELIRCLYGLKPADEAVAGMCRHYIKDRWWAAWERARIWQKLIEMGPSVLPALKSATAEALKDAQAGIDGQIAGKQGEIDAEKDKGKKRELEKALQETKAHKESLAALAGELAQVGSLIGHFTAAKPGAEDVKALCAFYLRRPYGAQYPYVKEGDTSLLRPLHAAEDAMVRDTLTRWGAAALPALREFLAADAKAMPALQKKLDEEEASWKAKGGRAAGGPLQRIANERIVIVRMRQELADLGDLIKLAGSRALLSDETIATLCRIYTRYDWQAQRAIIRGALKRRMPQAAEVIRKHAESEQAVIADAIQNVNRMMGKTVSDPVKANYDYYKDLARNIRQGLAELQKP
jgi:hypothetical protein